MAIRARRIRKGISIMMENNPDVMRRRIEDRQEAIREDITWTRSQHSPHPLRVTIGRAIIRAGERIQGRCADRALEMQSQMPGTARSRYARS